MKVSVIIPSYKPGAYLWDCLESLARQTLDPAAYEVILVLNGCGEPWQSRIEAFLRERMGAVATTFVQTDAAGVSNARNLGLARAQGEYIAFVDDDDYVSEGYLEELLRLAGPDTVPLADVFAFADGENGIRLPYRESEAYRKYAAGGKHRFPYARSYFSGPCLKLLHRDIVGDRRFDPRLSVGEDTLFMFAVSDRIRYVDFTSERAVYYRRIREGSALATARPFAARFRDNLLQLWEYGKCVGKRPFRYNFGFYLTRCAGAVRGMFLSKVI